MKKIILSFLLLLLVSFVFFVYNSFNGNPVSKYFAERALNHHLEVTYPEREFRVTEKYFDFKFSEYVFHIVEIGSGNAIAEEDGTESTTDIGRNHIFTVSGLPRPAVRIDPIRTSLLDTSLMNKLSEEAGEEIYDLLSPEVESIFAVDVYLEVLRGELDENVNWDKSLPFDRDPTFFIVLNSTASNKSDVFQEAVTIQQTLNEAGYPYERVTINGNEIGSGVSDKSLNRGYVKFAIGFTADDHIRERDITEH
ncbi:DUF3139 domain-containing protein [Evansella tamaricis]|uniref:DUF3139 domain-containing protein n=1 Tax=Evansella tamaricis TaxID=2069301 RepID=A0ABS6JFW8_9BACI|nr:DUF3139 domain-containing protein [Evansella tamaricis]MBU9712549.1 DUF3139 domain-containing protein [Evansella tamaricis]